MGTQQVINRRATDAEDMTAQETEGQWLFPGADRLYAAYVRHYGQTFAEEWLAHPEWQILLACIAGVESDGSVVNPNSLPIITDRSIRAYMETVRKVKNKRAIG